MDKQTEKVEIKIEPPVISIIGLTLQEVAAALRVHPRSVFKLIEDEDLPARKVAGGWRVEQEALRQWLANGRDKPVKYNIKKNQKPEEKHKQETKVEPKMPMRRMKWPNQAKPEMETKSEQIIMRRGKP